MYNRSIMAQNTQYNRIASYFSGRNTNGAMAPGAVDVIARHVILLATIILWRRCKTLSHDRSVHGLACSPGVCNVKNNSLYIPAVNKEYGRVTVCAFYRHSKRYISIAVTKGNTVNK